MNAARRTMTFRTPRVRPGWRFAVALCLCVQVAAADAQQAGGSQQAAQTAQALARAQGLLRQIGQQKQQLEVDNAKLKAELASVQQRLRKAEMTAEETAARLVQSTRKEQSVAGALERTKSRVDDVTTKLRDTVARYRELARQQRDTLAERDRLTTDVADLRRELAAAEQLNLSLYEDNREILCRFERKRGWDGLLQREPVTGIGGVAVENVLEEYNYEMVDYLREANLDQIGEMGEDCRVSRVQPAKAAAAP